jgi:hypothetical protein
MLHGLCGVPTGHISLLLDVGIGNFSLRTAVFILEKIHYAYKIKVINFLMH